MTSKHSLIYETKKLIQDMKYGLNRFIKYQIATKILLTLLLIPLFSFTITLLMRSNGFVSLTNSKIINFIITPQGILSLVILSVLATLVILIEIGGIVTISHQVYLKQNESSFFTILKFCLNKIPKLLGFGGIIIILYFFFLAPFLDIGIHTSLISSLEIPGFIQDYIDQNSLLIILQILLTIIFLICSIRWIFAIHFIILENKSAHEALKASSLLVKNNLKIFLKKFIGLTILNISFSLFLFVIYLFVTILIVLNLNPNTYTGKFVFSILFLFHQLGIIAITFIAVPLQIQIVTRLYYTFTYKSQNIVHAKLNFKVKHKPNFIDKLFKHKKVLFLIFILFFFLCAGILSLIINELSAPKADVKITSHRANITEAPENTLSAIKVAINHKSDFAEIDVQESKDGKIFILHDTTFKRIANVNKHPWELTYDEIRKLDAGSLFDKKFKGEKIPLLEEAIDLAKGKIKLNIEIKKNGHEKNLVPEVVNIIQKKRFINSCVVTSLDYDVLQQVKKLNPKIKTGYIMFFAAGDLSKLNIDFYSIEETNVSEEFINTAHSLKRQVHVWTINDDSAMEELIDLGVDNIITDNDLMLRNLLNDQKKSDPQDKIFNLLFD